jgi:hypothetical protein
MSENLTYFTLIMLKIKSYKTMTGKTLAAKLHNIENGILGVKNNPEIQDKLSVYGYKPEGLI